MIALYINALCPSVLQLDLPFKIELSMLVLKKLIDCLHDTFITSKTSITKLGFQFRKQVEVRIGVKPDGEEFQSAVSCSSNGNLGCVSWCWNRTPWDSLPSLFTREFLTRSCTDSTVSSSMASFGRPDRSSSPTLSVPLLNSGAHLSQCYRKGTPSQVYPWSLHGFPWGTSRYLMMALISTFSIWSNWHTSLLIKVCFMLLNLCKTACSWVSNLQ
jgi:hypothetical protein